MKTLKRPFRLTRITIMALFALLLLLGSVTTFTYALYHNELNQNTAKLQAGDLEVSAKYVKLSGTKTDVDPASANYGRFISFTENKDIAITEAAESIFDITSAAPTMTQTAVFDIVNGGAIAYDIEVRACDLVKKNSSAADTALSEQILITIECGTAKKEFRLSELEADDSCLKIESVSPNVTKTVSVTATFLDDTPFNNDADATNDFDNMDAIDGAIDFDITIIVVQDTDVAA